MLKAIYNYFKRVENYLNDIRDKYPEITNDLLFNNGEIIYINKDDNSVFDIKFMKENSKYYIFYKNATPFIDVSAYLGNYDTGNCKLVGKVYLPDGTIVDVEPIIVIMG